MGLPQQIFRQSAANTTTCYSSTHQPDHDVFRLLGACDTDTKHFERGQLFAVRRSRIDLATRAAT